MSSFSSGVPISALEDLLNGTIQYLDRGHVEQALLYQSTPGVDQVFAPSRRKVKGGPSVGGRISLSDSGTARQTRDYATNPAQRINTTTTITHPWTITEDSYLISLIEIDQNRGDREQVFDIVRQAEIDMLQSKINHMEGQIWGVPASSTDELNARGIPYWLSPIDAGNTDPLGSFNGKTITFLDGSTSTIKAGINAANPPADKWRNFAGTYNNIDGAFLKLMANAVERCRFYPSQQLRGQYRGPEHDFCIYTNQQNMVDYQELVNLDGKDRNGDAYPYASSMLNFLRIPIVSVPKLNDFAFNPWYMVNHRRLSAMIMRGWWFKRHPAQTHFDNANLRRIQVNSVWQLGCDNVRELGAVLHNPI